MRLIKGTRFLGSRGLTRTSVLLVLATVGLPGCGDGGGTDDAAATTSAKVSTKFGEVSIPSEPKRVGPWVTGRYPKAPEKIGTLEPGTRRSRR